jgi:hypothetical protein
VNATGQKHRRGARSALSLLLPAQRSRGDASSSCREKSEEKGWIPMAFPSSFRIVALAVLFSGASCAFGTEQADSDTLEKLKADVARVLPAGWTLEITPAAKTPPSRGDLAPCLVISSAKPLSVRFNYPNPASGEKKTSQLEIVDLTLTAGPLMSPEEYAAARQKNLENNEARLNFMKKLKDIRWGHMGAEPFPPSAYEPNSEAERRLVREYAFVWMRTEPRPLPTHSYGTLSFTRSDQHYMTVDDPHAADELAQIKKSLDRILTPYVKG